MRKSLFLVLLSGGLLLAQVPDEAVDWTLAKELFQRSQRGETLTVEDQRYLDRAKEQRKRGSRPERGQADQRSAPESLKPLCDMTAEDRYEGEDGGLYGAGKNEPPEWLQKRAEGAAKTIRPMNAEGRPDDQGRIVLVSISMSNATQEFSAFKRIADADARKSERVTIVDCAQGGQAMAEWVPVDGRPWQEAMRRIQSAGVSPAQVQAAWIKMANKMPTGSMQVHLEKLEQDTLKVIDNARERFPNLKVIYLGSRIWGGNASSGLNPEPYAYESAFGARHLILKQQKEVDAKEAPVLVWGPYLWAEGEKGRKTDDLKYVPSDFAGDGVHPSESGRGKVARQLLEFFAGSPLAKGWFVKPK